MQKVVKFGGSSLANSTQFEKVKNIDKSDISRRIVVVSALGKRNKDDYKITDPITQKRLNINALEALQKEYIF